MPEVHRLSSVVNLINMFHTELDNKLGDDHNWDISPAGLHLYGHSRTHDTPKLFLPVF